MEERFTRLLSQTCWVGCLIGGVATLYFLFGLAGHVHSPLLNLGVALTLSGALGFFLYQFSILPKGSGWIGWAVWSTILLIFVLEAVLGLLPPTSRDELTHHLAIPKLYAQAGRVIEVSMAPYAYYPMLLDMLFTPWVYWGYDSVPKWIHLLFGALTLLLLQAYLGRRLNVVYGLLGGFFFLSTPVILRLSHWGYVDLGLTFYATAALLCLLRWREDRQSLHWLALAGLSLGFALSTKPNGLLVALLMGLIFVLALVSPPRRSLAAVSREIVCFSLLTLAPILPWLIKNWWQTGNPFYPFFGTLFVAKARSGGQPEWAAQAVASFADIGIFAKRELLYGEQLWQIAALPLRVFFSGQDDNPQYFDGVLTPVLILFLPWAFVGKWLEDKKYIAGFVLSLLLCALFLVDMRIRYILPLVPLLVILLDYGIFNIYLRIKQPMILFVVLLGFAGWHGAYLWKYVSENAPWDYLAGAVSRTEYLARAMPEYSAFRYINQDTPRTAKIYLLFVGRRAYYCERDYFHDGGDLPGYLLGLIRGAGGPEQIAQSLRQKQITHLMTREDLLTRFLSNNLTAGQVRLWNEFAAQRLELGFRARGYAVYRLHD